jgi:hypothetical protein
LPTELAQVTQQAIVADGLRFTSKTSRREKWHAHGLHGQPAEVCLIGDPADVTRKWMKLPGERLERLDLVGGQEDFIGMHKVEYQLYKEALAEEDRLAQEGEDRRHVLAMKQKRTIIEQGTKESKKLAASLRIGTPAQAAVGGAASPPAPITLAPRLRRSAREARSTARWLATEEHSNGEE